MKQKFKLVGLSKEKSLTCKTLTTEDFFWPTNNLTQAEFDSLYEYFSSSKDSWEKERFVWVTCDGLYEDGTPIHPVAESLTDIEL